MLRPEDGVVGIPPRGPHRLWPVAQDGEENEETVMLLWAHPKGKGNEEDGKGEGDMDHLFFEYLFRYVDEGCKSEWLDSE